MAEDNENSKNQDGHVDKTQRFDFSNDLLNLTEEEIEALKKGADESTKDLLDELGLEVKPELTEEEIKALQKQAIKKGKGARQKRRAYESKKEDENLTAELATNAKMKEDQLAQAQEDELVILKENEKAKVADDLEKHIKETPEATSSAGPIHAEDKEINEAVENVLDETGLKEKPKEDYEQPTSVEEPSTPAEIPTENIVEKPKEDTQIIEEKEIQENVNDNVRRIDDEVAKETKKKLADDRAEMENGEGGLSEREEYYKKVAAEQGEIARNEAIEKDINKAEGEARRHREVAEKFDHEAKSEFDPNIKYDLESRAESSRYQSSLAHEKASRIRTDHAHDFKYNSGEIELTKASYNAARAGTEAAQHPIAERTVRRRFDEESVKATLASKAAVLKSEQDAARRFAHDFYKDQQAAQFAQMRAETEKGYQVVRDPNARRTKTEESNATNSKIPDANKYKVDTQTSASLRAKELIIFDLTNRQLQGTFSNIQQIDKDISFYTEAWRNKNLADTSYNKKMFDLLKKRRDLIASVKNKNLLKAKGIAISPYQGSFIGPVNDVNLKAPIDPKSIVGAVNSDAVKNNKFLMGIERKLDKTVEAPDSGKISRRFVKRIQSKRDAASAKAKALKAGEALEAAKRKLSLDSFIKNAKDKLSAKSIMTMGGLYALRKYAYSYEGDKNSTEVNKDIVKETTKAGLRIYGTAQTIKTLYSIGGVIRTKLLGTTAAVINPYAGFFMKLRSWFGKVGKSISSRYNSFANRGTPNLLSSKAGWGMTAAFTLVAMLVGIFAPMFFGNNGDDQPGPGVESLTPWGMVTEGIALAGALAIRIPMLAFIFDNGSSGQTNSQSITPQDAPTPSPQVVDSNGQLDASDSFKKQATTPLTNEERIQYTLQVANVYTNSGVNTTYLKSLSDRAKLDPTDPNYITQDQYKAMQDSEIQNHSLDPIALADITKAQLLPILEADDISKYHATTDDVVTDPVTNAQTIQWNGKDSTAPLLDGMTPIDDPSCPDIIHMIKDFTYTRGGKTSYTNPDRYISLDPEADWSPTFDAFKHPLTFSIHDQGQAILDQRNNILDARNQIVKKMNELNDNKKAFLLQNQDPKNLYNSASLPKAQAMDDMTYSLSGNDTSLITKYVVDAVQPAPGSMNSINYLDIVTAAAYMAHDNDGTPRFIYKNPFLSIAGLSDAWNAIFNGAKYSQDLSGMISELMDNANLITYYYQDTIKHDGQAVFTPPGYRGYYYCGVTPPTTDPGYSNWVGLSDVQTQLAKDVNDPKLQLQYTGAPVLHRTYYWMYRDVKGTTDWDVYPTVNNPTLDPNIHQLATGNGYTTDWGNFMAGVTNVIPFNPMIRTYPDPLAATQPTVAPGSPTPTPDDFTAGRYPYTYFNGSASMFKVTDANGNTTMVPHYDGPGTTNANDAYQNKINAYSQDYGSNGLTSVSTFLKALNNANTGYNGYYEDALNAAWASQNDTYQYHLPLIQDSDLQNGQMEMVYDSSGNVIGGEVAYGSGLGTMNAPGGTEGASIQGQNSLRPNLATWPSSMPTPLNTDVATSLSDKYNIAAYPNYETGVSFHSNWQPSLTQSQILDDIAKANQTQQQTISKDLTDNQKRLLTYALQLVGTVGFYWGGKFDNQDKDDTADEGYYDNFVAMYGPKPYQAVVVPNPPEIVDGLDCSGFVQAAYIYALGLDNKSMPTGTGTLVPDSTNSWVKVIDYNNLLPGDLVGYHEGKNGHVAIALYRQNLSNGQMGSWVFVQAETSKQGITAGHTLNEMDDARRVLNPVVDWNFN